MKELMLPNKFLLLMKVPLIFYLILKYSINFMGTSLMTLPRYPALSLFQRPLVQTIFCIFGNKIEIILQVNLAINYHQILAPFMSIYIDLIKYILVSFITLQCQYYLVVLATISFGIMPRDYYEYSILALDNFRINNSQLLSQELDCSIFQTIMISICIYYYFRLRQNKINSFLKLSLLSFFCKIILSYTFLNDYPLLPIFTLGNFMFGFIASESILPFRTEELKMQNTKIEPYPNVYTQTIERFTKSRFWFLWLVVFVVSPFLVSTIAFFQQGCLQALLVNISDIMTTVMASTLLIYKIQCFPSTDETIGPFLQAFRKVDRSAFLVQQPLYGYLINRFKLVQLGPYNSLILIMLYLGIMATTILFGFILSWFFEDVLFFFNAMIVIKFINQKKQNFISQKLIQQQYK